MIIVIPNYKEVTTMFTGRWGYGKHLQQQRFNNERYQTYSKRLMEEAKRSDAALDRAINYFRINRMIHEYEEVIEILIDKLKIEAKKSEACFWKVLEYCEDNNFNYAAEVVFDETCDLYINN